MSSMKLIILFSSDVELGLVGVLLLQQNTNIIQDNYVASHCTYKLSRVEFDVPVGLRVRARFSAHNSLSWNYPCYAMELACQAMYATKDCSMSMS